MNLLTTREVLALDTENREGVALSSASPDSAVRGGSFIPLKLKVDRRRRVNPTPPTVANPPKKARGVAVEWPDPGCCVWPRWGDDPGSETRTFCGARAKLDAPYCEAHMALAYRREDEDDRKR